MEAPRCSDRLGHVDFRRLAIAHVRSGHLGFPDVWISFQAPTTFGGETTKEKPKFSQQPAVFPWECPGEVSNGNSLHSFQIASVELNSTPLSLGKG